MAILVAGKMLENEFLIKKQFLSLNFTVIIKWSYGYFSSWENVGK